MLAKLLSVPEAAAMQDSKQKCRLELRDEENAITT
jgi:hypothetical protein